MAQYEVWIDSPLGGRYLLLDNVLKVTYSLVLNSAGYFSLLLPGNFDVNYLHVDNVVEIWRGSENEALKLAFVGFLRRLKWFDDDNGTPYVEVSGMHVSELLKRRIMAYYAEEATTNKTDYADDMMKAMVRENLGSLATDTDRDLTAYGFSVAADVSLGPSISKAFAWRNLLDALKDVADSSDEAGTEMFFDVVPSFDSDGMLLVEFQTFINQRGADRTMDSGDPVFFGEAWGNLTEGEYEEDYSEEISYVYAGGQGVADMRVIQEVEDLIREATSPWNRREAWADARNEAATAGVAGKGNAVLADGRPKKRFKARLLDFGQFRYGVHWDFGDRVSCEYRGQWFDAMVRSVVVSVDQKGRESIDVRVDTE